MRSRRNEPDAAPWRVSTGALIAGVLSLAVVAGGLAADHRVSIASPHEAPPATDILAGRAVTRLALLDLRLVGAPTLDDYRIAAEIMALGAELDPTDETSLRLRIECADGMRDKESVLALTRQLVTLRPDDTVSQLRLISAKIGEQQDAESRLREYDRLLGPAGARLDPSVRSRLALDSALLLREQGRTAEFADRLADAVALDPTNKDAASLAVTYFTQSTDDAVGRLELLLGLLYADPLDPESQIAVARELARGGAYKGAMRFYNYVGAVYQQREISLVAGVQSEQLMTRWCTVGAKEIVNELAEESRMQRSGAASAIKAAEAAGQPTDNLQKPEDTRFSLEVDRVRLLAASAIDDAEQVNAAYADLNATINKGLDDLERALADVSFRMQDVSDDDVREKIKKLSAERLLLRLWCARDLEVAAAEIESLAQDPTTRPEGVSRLRAWLALRQGDLDDSERLLKELPESDQFGALANAIIIDIRASADALSTRSTDPKVIAAYGDVAERFAGSLAGAYALEKVRQLTGSPPLPSPLAARIEAIAAGVPNWMDRVVGDPNRFMTLTVKGAGDRFDLLDDPSVTVIIRNVLPIPLGLSATGPINSTLLFTPKLELGGRRFGDGPGAVPVVASAHQRLRIMPFESFSFTIRPGVGPLGWGIQEWNTSSLGLRWRMIQGFDFTPAGTYRLGPYCLQDESDAMYRQRSADTERPAQQIADEIGSASGSRLAEIILSVRGRMALAAGAPSALTAEGLTTLGQAFAGRYPALEPTERLFVTAIAPTARRDPAFAPLDAAIRADSDPRVRIVAMLTRINAADDALLTQFDATEPAESRIHRLAPLLAARALAGRACLATTADPTKAVPVNPMKNEP